MAEDYISIDFSDAPHISMRESGFLQGERYWKDYDEEELLEMLRKKIPIAKVKTSAP